MVFLLSFLIGLIFTIAGIVVGASHDRPILGWFVGTVAALITTQVIF